MLIRSRRPRGDRASVSVSKPRAGKISWRINMYKLLISCRVALRQTGRIARGAAPQFTETSYERG